VKTRCAKKKNKKKKNQKKNCKIKKKIKNKERGIVRTCSSGVAGP
jgi:hypothetical protein